MAYKLKFQKVIMQMDRTVIKMKINAVLIWGVPILFALITCALLLHPDRLPFALKALGVLLIVRAFFIILTPMGFRADQAITSPEGFLQQLAYSNDFFFSGHVSIPFLFAFIFWDERWIRYVMFSISGIFAACVLLAHTHYSIDVFVVPFIVPTVYRFSLWFFGSDREPFAEAFSPSFAGSTSLL
jgi:hypothetical protein